MIFSYYTSLNEQSVTMSWHTLQLLTFHNFIKLCAIRNKKNSFFQSAMGLPQNILL